MGKNFFKKSSLVIVMVLAVVLTIIPKTAVLADDDNENSPTIEYRAHVQDIGWMDFVKSGLAGTEGQSKRLEALEIKAKLPEGAELSARAHVQDIGWQDWQKSNDVTVGTEGLSKRLEALQISVTGLEGYEVKYRAHVQDIGWQDWVTASTDSDNNTLNVFAGTVGQSKRLEALEIQVAETEESKLSKAKEEAIDELNGHLNPEEYSFNAEALKSAIAEGENAINEATTLEDVQSALDTAKANLDAIPNDEKALSDAKTEAKQKIDEYMGTLDTTNYTQRNLNKLMDTYNESSNKLFDATTPQEVKDAFDSTMEALKSVRTNDQVAEAKQDVKDMLDEYMSTLDTVKYSEKGLLEDVIDIMNQASDDLFNANTVEEVEKVSDAIMEKLEEIKAQVEHVDHQFGDYENVKSYTSSTDMGTHAKICKVCGYKIGEEEHKYTSESTYIPHTQTEKGGAGTIMTCSVCGDVYKIIVREDDDFKHEFQYIYDQATDTHKKTCKVCGLTETEDCDYEVMDDGDTGTHSIVCKNCKGVKAVHKWSEGTITNQNSQGDVPASEHIKKEYTCADDPEHCDAKKTTEEHRWAQMPGKDPTCTEDGRKVGIICLACKEVKTGYETIPALGHDEAYKCNNSDENSNCTQHKKYCKRCNIDLTGYEDCTYGDWIPEDGENKHNKTCTVCGGKYTEDCTEQVTKNAVEATCNKKGLTEEKQCSVCKKITQKQEETEINPNNHNPSRLSYVGNNENHLAFCMDCSAQLKKEEHTYGEWEQSSEEEKEKGIFVKHCTKCNIPVYQTSLKNALQDAKNGTGKVTVSNFTVKADSITVPEGVTLEVFGTLSGKSSTSIKNKGNIVITEDADIDANTITQIQNEDNGKVTMEVKDNNKFKTALNANYVTDIVLTNNINIDAGQSIQERKKLTIDLNGKTFERTDEKDQSQVKEAGCTGILNQGKITIKNGTLKDNKNSKNTVIVANNGGDAELLLENVTVEGGDYGVFNKDGELTITGNSKINSNVYGIAVAGTHSKLNITGTAEQPVIIKAGSMGISTHGQGSNINVNVSYTNITSDGVVAYLPADDSTTTFSNCTMQGQGGIEALAGTINVNNCTITATGSKNEDGEVPEYQKDGSVCDGSAIFLRSQKGYSSNEKQIKLNISESTLNPGEGSQQVRVHKSSKGAGVKTITITGDYYLTVDIDEDINDVTVNVNGIQQAK